MIQQTLNSMKQQEQDAALPPSEWADSELLMRFVRRREQAAFELLVGKYAAMVLGVCTQILRDRHEAEDVFQATFLILAQRAHKIQNTSNVGAWLHQVAYRAAVKVAKQRQQRLKRHSEQMTDDIEAADNDQWDSIATREEQAVLHEELDRMPQRYREPLVLCYLQGMSQTEAADELDLTFSVVNGRMTRGKQMLRMRLLRRGVAFSAVFATASASVASAQAASMSSLVSITTETCAATVLHGSTEIFLTNVGKIAQEGVAVMKMTLVPRMAAAVAMLFAAVVAMDVLNGTGVSGEPFATLTIMQTVAAAELEANVGAAFVAAPAEEDEKTSDPASADEKPAAAKTPALVATLEVGKDTYTLPPHAGDRPFSPAVDLTLVLTNTSDKQQLFSHVEWDDCRMDLNLEGDGARTHPYRGVTSTERRGGRTITLAPGKSYRLPIKNLNCGFRYADFCYWTKPGEYTLTASYNVGNKSYTAKPVKLKVIVAKPKAHAVAEKKRIVGSVTKVDGTTLHLSVGKQDGVAVGQEFHCFLAKSLSVYAKMRITEVNDKSSKAELMTKKYPNALKYMHVGEEVYHRDRE